MDQIKDFFIYSSILSFALFIMAIWIFVLKKQLSRYKQIEIGLIRRERKFRALFENMVQGAFYQRANGILIDVNPAALQMLGLTRDQFLGKDSYDPSIKVIKEDGTLLPVREHPSMLALKTGKPVLNKILAVFNSKTNRYTWLTINALPLFENQRVSHVFVTMHNITDQKNAEEAVLKTNIELEKRVKERTLDLKKPHEKLLHADKFAAIGSLSASIAHEFNNPFQGVLNIIKGIKRRVNLDEDDSKLMEMAIKECNRMVKLIKSLQDFNRPTSGRFVPMNIHTAIDSILLLVKEEYRMKNITLKKRLAKNIPHLNAVGDQIKQVLLNILKNAADACDGGGTIIVQTESLGSEIAIKVKDDGIGIKKEDFHHIFDPFFTTKPSVNGYGLGLSVSYGIIKSHGGNITVNSSRNKGSEFIIILPIKEENGAKEKHIDCG